METMKQQEKINTSTFLKTLLVIPAFIAAQAAGFGLQKCSDLLQFPAIAGIMGYSITFIGLFILLLSLLFNKILHIKMSDFRIGKITLSPIILFIGFLLPLFVILVSTRFEGRWIRNDSSSLGTITTIIQALFYYGLSAGIVEELVFRGVLMTALEKRFNKAAAVIIPSMLFGIGHVIGRDLSPLSIIYLFVAGTSVGIMFSLVVYASRTIWSSVFIHTLWNICVGGNILKISHHEGSNAVYTYLLKTNSFLVTGGDFGIDASLTAVIGYFMVCLIVLLFIRKRRKISLCV